MATTIGAYNLATAEHADPRYYEPQRPTHFEFSCPALDDMIANGNERIRLAVDASSIPYYSQSPLTIKRGNTEIHFAGSITFNTHTIKIIDYIGAATKEVLVAWQKQSGDPSTQMIGLAKDYKKLAYLIEYDPTFTAVRTWTLTGCWISGLQENDFDMSSGSESSMSISATITFDSAELSAGVDESAGL